VTIVRWQRGPWRSLQLSLLVIEVPPQGMIFGADRNRTVVRSFPDGSTTSEQQSVCKIVRWPGERALAASVGSGGVGKRATNDWLLDFMGRNSEFAEPKQVAERLCTTLQEDFGGKLEMLIVEFGAFAQRGPVVVPEMWHISNVHGMNVWTGEYNAPTATFGVSEQILGERFKGTMPEVLKTRLKFSAESWEPFWFHQTVGLDVFNTLEKSLSNGFAQLQRTRGLRLPATLPDWERYTRMKVLMFGAFFEAFAEPGSRYVGGGADVFSIPWPEKL
jgi:hypothetical protein